MLIKHLLPLFLLSPCVLIAADNQTNFWSGNIDFGYQKFTGNTDEETINGEIKLVREHQAWKWVNHARLLYSEVDSQRNAEKYDFATYLSYNFTDNAYVFGRIVYETDKFSGFDYQVNYVAGFGWNIYELKKFTWDAEAGAGYRTSAIRPPSTEKNQDEAIATLSTKLQWQMTDNTEFNQYVSYEVGEDLNITYSNSELSVGLMDNLALKLSYNIKHSSKVPVNTDKTDSETLLSLSYAF